MVPDTRVALVMLSKGLGGLEQAFIDYAEALTHRGHRVVAINDPDWPRAPELDALGVERFEVANFGEWDPFATRRIKSALEHTGVAAAITIGRRASALVRRGIGSTGRPVQIGVTPNYSFKALVGLPHVIAITEDIRRALVGAGQHTARISVIPNLIRVPQGLARPDRAPDHVPVIGAIGRFVPKKGFADFLDALARLEGRTFRAVLAGDGPEDDALRAQVQRLGLQQRVAMPGWIGNVPAFLSGLDVLVVPSHHEPFGIVVLEGMAHALPLVVSDAEGPREIVEDGIDALLVPKQDPPALAAALARLLDEPMLRERLATAARQTALERYDLPVVAERIEGVLLEVLA